MFDATPKKKPGPKTRRAKAQAILPGISASPGIAIGKVFMLADDHLKTEQRLIAEAQIPTEIERLKNALAKTRDDLEQDGALAANAVGKEQARIFEYHRLMLEDEYFIGEIVAAIRQQRFSATHAFEEHLNRYAEQLGKKDRVFRERAADVHDVKRRVLRHLRGDAGRLLNHTDEPVIIVSHELTPSLTLTLDRRKIKAFATDLGGKTSHATLLARSYGIPAVVGLHHLTCATKNGDRIIVDGYKGLVVVNPDRATLAKYRAERDQRAAIARKLDRLRLLAADTVDHHHLELAANVEFASEIEAVKRHGAMGIGLLRTEYLYFGCLELPSEEEQYLEYSRIAGAIKPHAVIIRTMDVGADKRPHCLDIPAEANPMLGWRAIRISFEKPEIFITQIKAILRANMHGNLRILLPMISSIEELEKALALIEQAKQALDKEGKAFQPDTKVGVMIEVPAAALLAEAIAERVDFLSIGTNDLVQYLLAVDRGNDRIAHLYENLHPAVLRVIKSVIDAGHRRGVWVGMCGEMAADRLATVLLVGMGIDELSVSPIDVPEIKKIIRRTSFGDAKKLAQKALTLATATEIRQLVRHYMRPRFKDLSL
ncbi:MAG: phosphoenolpyruvate--protein phosphotransferase [candidate division KSB1 bacterium]|nr:phosphoenolpyruvate--protein phosphotransferase [candidate division KSB1 bacterium]MDZ7366136.1 phosphoenolpyruvate--protein phosphotransferase [candidate division KSB1 bacterium]MDZ7404222.1 phosphoenolpyruvate--protein phosphotransferase [candidate division KSB1 bacterium]